MPVDDLKLFVIVFKCDDGTEKILIRGTVELLRIIIRKSECEKVIPLSSAFIFTPSIGTLIVGD